MPETGYRHYQKRSVDNAPLLFTFHGTGGTEMQFAEAAEALMPEAAVISPRGDVSEHGAARFFQRTGEGVYDMADLALRTEKMAGFVAGWREQLHPARTVGLGYSNGANILAAVVFKHPGLFDAIILLHPLVPWRPEPNAALAPMRVLVTAGQRDPICPPAQSAALAAWFEQQGCAVSLRWHDGGHELRPGELADAKRFLQGQKL